MGREQACFEQCLPPRSRFLSRLSTGCHCEKCSIRCLKHSVQVEVFSGDDGRIWEERERRSLQGKRMAGGANVDTVGGMKGEGLRAANEGQRIDA